MDRNGLKASSVLALFLAAGCAVPPPEEQSPSDGGAVIQLPQDSGSLTTPPPRVAWKDATGAVATWDQTTYQDANGRTWFLDVETAQVSPTSHQASIGYSAAGCTGTAYVPAQLPRVPFKAGAETVYRLRPDNVASQSVAIASVLPAGGSCLNTTQTWRAVPLAQVPQDSNIQTPTFGWVAPLHQERQ